MNERKIQKLFEAAKKEQPPVPKPDFDADVMRAIRHEPHVADAETVSLRDALDALFPRLAWASAFVIIACVTGDYFLTPHDSMGLTDEVAQASEQWLFVEEGF